MMKYLPTLVTALLLAAGVADAAPVNQPRLAYQPRIICGATGCFEVPPGCRGEMRPVGRSLTAVVICDRR
jgi:hypothetical protein